MGNKHTKQEYASCLNKLGELLWKLVLPYTNDSNTPDEIISSLYYNLNEEEYQFVFDCKYFNPIHYIILSGLWLPHDIYLKLTTMIEVVYHKCKYNKTESKTKILVFQNNNHVSNVNLNYIKMEEVKASLMRRGTMDINSQAIVPGKTRSYSLPAQSVQTVQIDYKENNSEEPEKIRSYIMHGREIKPPPPIKRNSIKEDKEQVPEKKELERPLTYYMMSDEEKKNFNTLTEKQIINYMEQTKRRISTKKIWFNYAIYNQELWKTNDSESALYEQEIGNMSYLSIISLLQIKMSGKYSSIPDAQKNMIYIYQKILEISLKKKRKSSVKDKIKSIFT